MRPLEDSGPQNDEKMLRETVHSQSYATYFRHSAVLSLPAVLLGKFPIPESSLFADFIERLKNDTCFQG